MIKVLQRPSLWTIFSGAIAIIILMFIILNKAPIGIDDRKKIPVGKAQIHAVENLIIQYYTDTGYYPSTSEGLKALMERPSGPAGAQWNGPYAREPKFTDGWGYLLHYKCPGTHNPDTYDLWSYGADGKEGGKEKNADIGNW
ncbi:MAG TPA: type II secretion system protein GspG [Bacillota bacterium]|nr:type II secretion system protein GspG [Bacillota bacterium]